ncbi:hypothetical protein RMHFA_05770 [Roseomonas mucosa]|nr:hypothetical protein RMHFA_05770 [Roseomonas mucosa]
MRATVARWAPPSRSTAAKVVGLMPAISARTRRPRFRRFLSAASRSPKVSPGGKERPLISMSSAAAKLT